MTEETQLQFRLDWGKEDEHHCPACGNKFFSIKHSQINNGWGGWECRKNLTGIYYVSKCGPFNLIKQGRHGAWTIDDIYE